MRRAAIPRTTPATATKDRQLVERFLGQDPVTTAVAWNRAFDLEGPREVYVDGEPPRALLATVRPPSFGGETAIAVHAVDPGAARDLLPAWPHGPTSIHLTEEWMLPLLQERTERFDGDVFWLFELGPKDFRDGEQPGVEPLDPTWADLVGKTWDPTWDLTGPYLRARIEAGHAYAVYQEGQPVAWTLLHFETPKVSMMGFLHVLEPYRGKGYARSVSSALVKDILSRGKIPALHVATTNVPSLELSASLGFHRVKKQVWGEAVLR